MPFVDDALGFSGRALDALGFDKLDLHVDAELALHDGLDPVAERFHVLRFVRERVGINLDVELGFVEMRLGTAIDDDQIVGLDALNLDERVLDLARGKR